jgi:hypothetical protein
MPARPYVLEALYRSRNISKLRTGVNQFHAVHKEIPLILVCRSCSGDEVYPYQCVSTTSARQDLRYHTNELLDGMRLDRVMESWIRIGVGRGSHVYIACGNETLPYQIRKASIVTVLCEMRICQPAHQRLRGFHRRQ